MTQNHFKRHFFLAVFIAVFSAPSLVLAGFGVTPPNIVADRLVPGATITKTVYLVQGNPEQDLDVRATIESRDIKDWISIEQDELFSIPRGVQQYPLRVTITVPEDASLGQYSGTIRVRTVPKPVEGQEEGASGVAIAIGGLITIDATVGDDVILEFRVTGLDILDIKEREPLQASVRIDNTGNVPASPNSASFELFDKFGTIRLAFARAEADQFPRVPAFTEDSVILTFPVDTVLAVGEYWGHVKIYDEDGDVVREIRTVFNVNERTLMDIITSAEVLTGIAVLIVIVVAFLIYRHRLRRQISTDEFSKETETAQ